MIDVPDNYWEYPPAGRPLADCSAVVDWLHALTKRLAAVAPCVLQVDLTIDQLRHGAGEVMRIADPSGQGPDLVMLVERIGDDGGSEIFVMVSVVALGDSDERSPLGHVAYDVAGGHLFGDTSLGVLTDVRFSRGDAALIDDLLAVIRDGVVRKRGWLRRRNEMVLKPYAIPVT